MSRPAPPALVLTFSMLAVSSPAAAATINLLQSQSGVDRQSATYRDDCVMLADDPGELRSRFGRVNWTHGRLSWEWEPGNEPLLVHLVCVERDPGEEQQPGSFEFGVGLSWARATFAASRWGTAMRATALAGAEPTSFETGPAPFISWPDIDGAPIEAPALFDIPGVIPTLTAESFRVPVIDEFGAGSASLTGPVYTRALRFGPLDTAPAPVPEPATWLLIGTGLAAAWRAARKCR